MQTVPLMRPLAWRRLTPGEVALAGEVFAGAVETARVRVLALPILSRAFVAGGGLIVWPARAALADFAAAGASLDAQASFVHELAHVWQAQDGVNLILAKLRAGDRPCAYAYDLERCGDFFQLNIEQQAMVVEDAFRLGRGGAAPYPATAYAARLPRFGGASRPRQGPNP